MNNKNILIMKKLITLTLVLFGCLTIVQAQENKTIKETTTVKKVVTKAGDKVQVKEIKETDTEKGAIVVENNDEEEQNSALEFKKDVDTAVVKDATKTNEENKALVAQQKKEQEMALQKSIEEQELKAEEERKIIEQQRQERLKMLEERKKALEKRSKGIVKLKKNQ